MQKIDAANAATYKKNSDSYIESLKSLDSDYKTVVVGFPFETIKNESERNEFMQRVLNFFENK